MYLLAAISLGFLGSFHCIGMCGPIALSIPVKRHSPFSVWTGTLVYNAGRIITYFCIGAMFGMLGQGFALAGWQSMLSVAIGVLILVFLLIPEFSILRIRTGPVFYWLESLKAKMRAQFGIHSNWSLLLIGLLNGLLPCGLVYLGIAGSVATGNALDGALFMAVFGMGTFPAMMAVTLARDFINLRFRQRIQKAVPVFAGMMAVMLILRGLNLGIPYLSPSIEVKNGISHHKCCSP